MITHSQQQALAIPLPWVHVMSARTHMRMLCGRQLTRYEHHQDMSHAFGAHRFMLAHSLLLSWLPETAVRWTSAANLAAGTRRCCSACGALAAEALMLPAPSMRDSGVLPNREAVQFTRQILRVVEGTSFLNTSSVTHAQAVARQARRSHHSQCQLYSADLTRAAVVLVCAVGYIFSW